MSLIQTPAQVAASITTAPLASLTFLIVTTDLGSTCGFPRGQSPWQDAADAIASDWRSPATLALIEKARGLLAESVTPPPARTAALLEAISLACH